MFWHHDAVAVSLVSPVLVGRQGEVQALSHALGRVLAGEQATIVVGGEAGVGKSRLVHELVGEAREPARGSWSEAASSWTAVGSRSRRWWR